MKMILRMLTGGAVLALAGGTLYAQEAPLNKTSFEVLKATPTVTIKAANSAQFEKVKMGGIYPFGNIDKIDVEKIPGKTTTAVEHPVTMNSFKVKTLENTVETKAGLSAKYKAAQVGAEYKFGTTVRTGRDAWTDLELLPKNMVRVLANSEVVIGPKMKNPKVVALNLKGGAVKSTLDSFPKDHLFEVQTPMAICGAVGTAFSVKYTVDSDGTMFFGVEVFEGVVAIYGQYMSVLGEGLKAGQKLEFTITTKGHSRIVGVRFYGQPGDQIVVVLWGREFTLTIPEAGAGTGANEAMAEVQIRIDADAPVPPVTGPGDEGGGEPVIWIPPPPPVPDVPQSPSGL